MLVTCLAAYPDMGSGQNVFDPVTTLAALVPEPALRAAQSGDCHHDDKMVAATLLALETGSITPLLKEELRCTIQARRLAEGKEEMQVEFQDPAEKTMELTPEEEVRVVKRREQNRSAAQRFRQKQKDTIHRLLKKTEHLQSENTTLRTQLRQLQSEKAEMSARLQHRVTSCPSCRDLLHGIQDNQNLTSHP